MGSSLAYSKERGSCGFCYSNARKRNVSGKHDARKREICVPVEATYKKRYLNLHVLACISIPGLETTKIRGKFLVNTSA